MVARDDSALPGLHVHEIDIGRGHSRVRDLSRASGEHEHTAVNKLKCNVARKRRRDVITHLLAPDADFPLTLEATSLLTLACRSLT
jgi:hypothetical protein